MLEIDSTNWPSGWCPVNHAIGLLEGRWTVLILRELFRDGSCRFRELQRRLGNLSPRTLADRLKRLERDNLIRRHESSADGDGGYGLTDRGKSLAPLFAAMIDWSEKDLVASEKDLVAIARTRLA